MAQTKIVWAEAQSWQLPEPVAAPQWLHSYTTLAADAQATWTGFTQLQQNIDEAVADWYGFTPDMRRAIAEGLPWARRRQPPDPSRFTRPAGAQPPHQSSPADHDC